MTIIQHVASLLAVTASVAGLVQGRFGLAQLERQLERPRRGPAVAAAVTVLKPLCGAEPLLEDALGSFFRQDYPMFQIVFGVHDPRDPAFSVVERLRRRYPDVDVAVVANATLHGRNRKIGNLINCLTAAKHDVLVISDSDVHVPTDYLSTAVAELEGDGVSLATSGYRGLAANSSLAARLGQLQIDLTFLPGVLLGRRLGRQDCLGATMAIRRETLARVGGLEALRDHLDDDNRLGRLVLASGGRVAMMPGVVAVTVPETSLRDLFDHELRWGRTIRIAAPVAHACSVLQYPVVWAVIAAAVSGAAWWTMAALAAAWAMRALIASRAVGAIRPSSHVDWLLLLPREAMSVALVVASFCVSRVRWRGVELDVGSEARANASATGHSTPPRTDIGVRADARAPIATA